MMCFWYQMQSEDKVNLDYESHTHPQDQKQEVIVNKHKVLSHGKGFME